MSKESALGGSPIAPSLDSRPQLWTTHKFSRVGFVLNKTTHFKT